MLGSTPALPTRDSQVSQEDDILHWVPSRCGITTWPLSVPLTLNLYWACSPYPASCPSICELWNLGTGGSTHRLSCCSFGLLTGLLPTNPMYALCFSSLVRHVLRTCGHLPSAAFPAGACCHRDLSVGRRQMVHRAERGWVLCGVALRWSGMLFPSWVWLSSERGEADLW